MQINSYSFGSIEVQGKMYTEDLIVYPDRVKSNWWRKEGHSLTIEDLEEIIDYKPEILVVGKGASSCMKVPLSIKNTFKEHRIELVDSDTDNACKLFNELIKKGKKVVGAFHLTC